MVNGDLGDLMEAALNLVAEEHKKEVDPAQAPPLNMAGNLVLGHPLRHGAVTHIIVLVNVLYMIYLCDQKMMKVLSVVIMFIAKLGSYPQAGSGFLS
jgi:hypothetical protein